MKCTNKHSFNRLKPRRITACILASGILMFSLSGCSDMKNISDAYNTYGTTASYGLGNADPTAADTDASWFASDLCTGGLQNTADNGVKTSTAGAAGVFNIDTNQIRYAKNIYQKMYPASTTKTLTAYLALKYGNLDDVITVSSTAVAVPTGSSVCGLKTGDKVTLRDALYGLLLMSGNDAATLIAEYISGSTSKFAVLMNEEAKKLGATHSHFVNPHGFPDSNHYTCVYDLYLIFHQALKNPDFRNFITTKKKTVTYQNAAGHKVTQNWTNSNWYLAGYAKEPSSVSVMGGKTGSSDASGYCLVLYSKNSKNEDIISIIMKSDTKENLYRLMSRLLVNFSN